MNDGVGVKDVATWVSLLATVTGGSIWAGFIASDVANLKTRADLTDDVAAMHIQIDHLDQQLDRIETKIDRRNQPDHRP